MASKIQRLGVKDYRIILDTVGDVSGGADNASITLDVGEFGAVNITGALDVAGELTSISSTDLEVSDNIIYINVGGGSAGGIPNTNPLFGQSGITIERFAIDGNNPQLVFDEALRTIDGSNFGDPSILPGRKGAFSFQSENSGADPDTRLRTNFGLWTQSVSVADDQNLYLLNNQATAGANVGDAAEATTGIVTVRGTAWELDGGSTLVPYEERVFPYENRDATRKIINVDGNQDRLASPPDQDALVTVKTLTDYVRDYHEFNYQGKIAKDYIFGSETKVEIFDDDADGLGSFRIDVDVNGSPSAKFYSTRVELNQIQVSATEISSIGANTSVTLRGNGEGVVVDDFQEFTVQDPLTVDTPVAGTRVYANTLADGGTGLYFAHQDGTRDELVSRNKALLFSIIF
jgi:hypothetical protein